MCDKNSCTSDNPNKTNITNDSQPIDNQDDLIEALVPSNSDLMRSPNLLSTVATRNPHELVNYPGDANTSPSPQVISIKNAGNVHIGQNMVFPAVPLPISQPWGVMEEIPQPKIDRTRTIDNMLKSTELVDQECIQLVAEHLGKGWQSVLRQLGQTDAYIEQLDRDFYKDGTKETIYRGLRKWMQSADDDVATVGTLTKILWKSGHRPCVVKLKDWFKNRQN